MKIVVEEEGGDGVMEIGVDENVVVFVVVVVVVVDNGNLLSSSVNHE